MRLLDFECAIAIAYGALLLFELDVPHQAVALFDYFVCFRVEIANIVHFQFGLVEVVGLIQCTCNFQLFKRFLYRD